MAFVTLGISALAAARLSRNCAGRQGAEIRGRQGAEIGGRVLVREFLKVAEADADKTAMAALPFARHIKKKAETETPPPAPADTEADQSTGSWEVAEFFSKDPRPRTAEPDKPATPTETAFEAAAFQGATFDGATFEVGSVAEVTVVPPQPATPDPAPPRMTVPPTANPRKPQAQPQPQEQEQPEGTAEPATAVATPVQGDPGWYPDAAEPGLMRYWDGFHMTGQTVRLDPSPAPAAPPAATPLTPTATEDTSAVTDDPATASDASLDPSDDEPAAIEDEDGEPAPMALAPPPSLRKVSATTMPAPNPAHYPSGRPVESGQIWSVLEGIDSAGSEPADGEDQASPADEATPV